MAMPTALKVLTLLSVLVLLAADQVEGRNHQPDCPAFSCGTLGYVSSPFRRASDPPGCGHQSYQLVCSDTKATIHIDNATCYVSGINPNDSTFWVVDANLDLYNSCPLPRWNQDQHPYGLTMGHRHRHAHHAIKVELAPAAYNQAIFVNCSQEVKHNGMYRPVACLSTSDSFVYVLTGHYPLHLEDLEPCCGYLAMSPLGGQETQGTVPLENASYADVVKFMTHGFLIEFPFRLRQSGDFVGCLRDLTPTSLGDLILKILTVDIIFLDCAANAVPVQFAMCLYIIQATLEYLRPTTVVCRFVVVLIFLAHKYWKTRITMDAVEKFLQMQQMIGPSRIHHVNVVRLVGFCSEEMRRALVYEYMPRGSLDKYIFSAEKSFSWDKLNEIALGIARGINYLHQGCEMQILHFDIKPHILLDNNFIPKVADFGLAKLYPKDNSFVPSRALRGTIGYIAPEMISRSFGVISSKSDVYSFGMLLLEMAGGRRNADPSAANSSQAYYPSWVYDRLTQQYNIGEISAQFDTEMHELERKLCVIGLWCIQMRSHDRPTMSEVIQMLEDGVDGFQMPSRPFFCDEGYNHAEDTYHLSSELTEISEEHMSESIDV